MTLARNDCQVRSIIFINELTRVHLLSDFNAVCSVVWKLAS